ncbi:amino acid racemase [Patescibacteria group bacterium]|nr:amino acid racemase [Patescibacteria group bacterium]
MDTKKTIGVLGGMGAAASADFYQRLVELAQKEFGAVRDSDFPPMLIYNLSIRDFDETGVVDADSVIAQLVAGVRTLESAGADFFVVPCNTVHRFAKEMSDAVSIPLVSIIDATADAVQDDGLRKVGILSSQTTRNESLYEKALASRGIAVLHADDAEQAKINEVIAHVMRGTNGAEDVAALAAIANRFKAEGAEGVALGCTELPLAITQKDAALPLYGSTEILARAALKYSLGTA